MDDEASLLPRKLQAALEQALEQRNDIINQDSDSESDEGEDVTNQTDVFPLSWEWRDDVESVWVCVWIKFTEGQTFYTLSQSEVMTNVVMIHNVSWWKVQLLVYNYYTSTKVSHIADGDLTVTKSRNSQTEYPGSRPKNIKCHRETSYIKHILWRITINSKREAMVSASSFVTVNNHYCHSQCVCLFN